MDLERLGMHTRNIAALAETASPVVSCYVNNEAGLAGYRGVLDERIRDIRRALTPGERLDFEHALAKIEAFLASGCSVEGASRRLLVHPNTVRYRLKRAHDLSGWSPSDPRGQFALRTALVLGRLADDSVDTVDPVVVDIQQRRAH